MAEAKPGETLILSWTPNGHLNNAKPTKVDILYYAEPGKEFGTYGEAQSAPKAATLDFATNANCKKPEDAGHPCTGQLKVPDNLKPGNTYSFVWFWHFNSNGAEEYTTCFDIKIV
ncbi:hypothetical protein EV182_002906 [Spiromyces aspiralis]|uniref:Uncharacterized protein n=1 Tax=Spiromyces aspiralis TaxID=68401 RepID=A0ACC1HRU8_9FUNG|nr:hypothetical protein EV182_002906 [Spiromyces aspiralis]